LGWKFVHRDSLCRQIVGDLGGEQNQVRGRVIGVEMNKVLQHRQGLMFGSVRETSAWARPAATVTIGAFAIEGRTRIGLAQHAIDLFRTSLAQLIPP